MGVTMKKVLAFFLLICLMICLSACDSSADELEQLKIEYSKYDQYDELVDALIIEDYDKVDDLIEGYKGQSVNTNSYFFISIICLYCLKK